MVTKNWSRKRNSKVFLKDNPEIAKKIEKKNKILESMGINDSIISSGSDDFEGDFIRRLIKL